MNGRMILSVCMLAAMLAVSGCLTTSLPSGPAAVTENGTSDDPSANRPIAMTTESRLVAAAKLQPTKGNVVAGEVEFYDRKSGVLVVGIAWGMDPASTYTSLLHDPASGCSVASPKAEKVGEWEVARNGVGTLKIVVPSVSQAALFSFSTISLRRDGRASGPAADVCACGQLEFR